MDKNTEILQKIHAKRRKKLLFLRMRLQTVFLFCIFFGMLLCGILFFLLPKKEVSEAEQRKLASFPSLTLQTLWNGDFTAGLNIYYSDNFIMRDALVKAKFALEEHKGLRFDDVKIYGSETGETAENAAQTPKENQKTCIDDVTAFEKITANQPNAPMAAIDLKNPYYSDPNKHFDFNKADLDDRFADYINMEKDQLDGEKRGNLFVVGDTALEIFYGNEQVSKDYAAVLNAYSDALGDSVTIYDMIVPNHFEYGLPSKYKGKIGKDEKPFLDLVKENLNGKIVFVDIYDTLKTHYNKGEYLYFRTDHHWTGLGAYRAYEKFCETAGLTAVPLDSYEKRISTGFLGTLYNSSLDKNLAANPDTVEYYVTDLPYEQTNTKKDGTTYKGRLISEYADGRTNGYLTFMGGDIPLATIKTENTSGRSIIVFKESYGNAFIPFLVPHYDTIYVADIRSFPYNAVTFIQNNHIGEVLFLNNIMTSNTSARVANILELLRK